MKLTQEQEKRLKIERKKALPKKFLPMTDCPCANCRTAFFLGLIDQLLADEKPRDLSAMNELISACEKEFCSDSTGLGEYRDPDDSMVMSPDSLVTFGMIRRARKLLGEISAPSPAAKGAEA